MLKCKYTDLSPKKEEYANSETVEVKEERPPSQLKMLERLRASKSFWKNEALKHLGEEKKDDDKKSISKSRPPTTPTAAARRT